MMGERYVGVKLLINDEILRELISHIVKTAKAFEYDYSGNEQFYVDDFYIEKREEGYFCCLVFL